MNSRITKWNPEKGFGFVSVDGKRVFVHCSAISPRPARGEDLTGHEVVVEKVDWNNPKGPSAVWVLTTAQAQQEGRQALEAQERALVLAQFKKGESPSLEELIAVCQNIVGDEASERYWQMAMKSPGAFQRALDIKEAWNQANPNNQKYVLGYGQPWFAEELRFVRFAANNQYAAERLTWAIWKGRMANSLQRTSGALCAQTTKSQTQNG
jgi:cold shock CspA family protein